MYPQQVTHHQLGAYTIALCRPHPQAVEAAFRHGLIPAAPYWARLWPAAIGLCRVLATYPEWVKGKQVLELGAGLGLPSLLAGRLGAAVHCTDGCAAVLPFVNESARLNGMDMHCSALLWQDAAAERPDVLLLSDVNYDPADLDQLYQTLLHFLQAGTTILLSTPQRLVAKSFAEQLLPFCREQFVEVVEEDGTGTAVSVLLLKQ